MATHFRLPPDSSDAIQLTPGGLQAMDQDGLNKAIAEPEGTAQDRKDMNRMGKIQEFKV